MKIGAIADLHGDETLIDKIAYIEADFIIVAGDITQRGPASYAEDIIETLPNMLAIPGNMDTEEIMDLLEETGKSIHRKRLDIGDFNIVGYGKSNKTPFGTPLEESDEKMLQEMDELLIDNKTIFVTHAPPFGYFDEVQKNVHVGSKAVLEIIKRKQPWINICAHIHEFEGTEQIGSTLVVKLPPASKGRGAMIEVETRSVSFILL